MTFVRQIDGFGTQRLWHSDAVSWIRNVHRSILAGGFDLELLYISTSCLWLVITTNELP